MKNFLLSIVRKIVRSLFKKDFLIINEESKIHRVPSMVIITQSSKNIFTLPIKYNYHSGRDWCFRYELFGNAVGTLHYSINIPGQSPFYETQIAVKLPCTWIVELEGNMLKVNGVSAVTVSSSTLDAVQLFVKFKIDTESGTLIRKAGHRIRLDEGSPNEDYFNKLVYRSYDVQSQHYPSEIITKLEQFKKLEGRLLDVGCATGLLVKYAMDIGLQAEGIDISEWAISKANERTNGKCRIIDLNVAENRNFPHKYEFIILNSVLEHLEDPQKVLNLIFNLCESGGIIYIQTLNADSLMHKILGNDWGGYTDYTHKSPWISSNWLKITAERIGFVILYSKTYRVWNDNINDIVWQSFSSILNSSPLDVLLEEGLGDIVELILQRP